MGKFTLSPCRKQRRRSATHPHMLISSFVVYCLVRIILVTICEISRLYPASVAEQAVLSSTGAERGLCHDTAQIPYQIDHSFYKTLLCSFL